ncbi:hypothetical protein [Embleya sp. NPDC059259]|uniref:hypothetical protein n=1 Tax=Embleya sp. NPDC059259 TaxID=3346796 RepID=UPI0036A3C623
MRDLYARHTEFAASTMAGADRLIRSYRSPEGAGQPSSGADAAVAKTLEEIAKQFRDQNGALAAAWDNRENPTKIGKEIIKSQYSVANMESLIKAYSEDDVFRASRSALAVFMDYVTLTSKGAGKVTKYWGLFDKILEIRFASAVRRYEWASKVSDLDAVMSDSVKAAMATFTAGQASVVQARIQVAGNEALTKDRELQKEVRLATRKFCRSRKKRFRRVALRFVQKNAPTYVDTFHKKVDKTEMEMKRFTKTNNLFTNCENEIYGRVFDAENYTASPGTTTAPGAPRVSPAVGTDAPSATTTAQSQDTTPAPSRDVSRTVLRFPGVDVARVVPETHSARYASAGHNELVLLSGPPAERPYMYLWIQLDARTTVRFHVDVHDKVWILATGPVTIGLDGRKATLLRANHLRSVPAGTTVEVIAAKRGRAHTPAAPMTPARSAPTSTSRAPDRPQHFTPERPTHLVLGTPDLLIAVGSLGPCTIDRGDVVESHNSTSTIAFDPREGEWMFVTFAESGLEMMVEAVDGQALLSFNRENVTVAAPDDRAVPFDAHAAGFRVRPEDFIVIGLRRAAGAGRTDDASKGPLAQPRTSTTVAAPSESPGHATEDDGPVVKTILHFANLEQLGHFRVTGNSARYRRNNEDFEITFETHRIFHIRFADNGLEVMAQSLANGRVRLAFGRDVSVHAGNEPVPLTADNHDCTVPAGGRITIDAE